VFQDRDSDLDFIDVRGRASEALRRKTFEVILDIC
jgi:hypothetical protein